MIKLRHQNRIARKKLFKAPLTCAEGKVIETLRHGKTHKEIAKELFLATSTVSTHIKNAMRHLRVNKETALVDHYLHLKHGIIDF